MSSQFDPYQNENYRIDFIMGSYNAENLFKDDQIISQGDFDRVLAEFQEQYDATWYEAPEDSQGSMGHFTNDDYDGVIEEVNVGLHEIAENNERILIARYTHKLAEKYVSEKNPPQVTVDMLDEALTYARPWQFHALSPIVHSWSDFPLTQEQAAPIIEELGKAVYLAEKMKVEV